MWEEAAVEAMPGIQLGGEEGMKLYEMMDRTPLPGRESGASDNKTYLAYMHKHRPQYSAELVSMLKHKGLDGAQNLLNAINLGADMALLQILQHGVPDDLPEVYGKNSSKLIMPW